MNNCESGQLSIISFIPSLVTIVGWMIVFRQTMMIKHREDIHNIVISTQKAVDEIYDLSIKYYGEENSSHMGFISSDIRAKFLVISYYLILLKEKGIKPQVNKYVIFYRTAVMGGYFETVDFKKQVEVPNRRSDISNGRSDLNFQLEKMYIDWARKIGFFSQFRMMR